MLKFLIVLFLGAIIGTFGMKVICIVFSPLFLLWLLNWDDKKYQERIQEDM